MLALDRARTHSLPLLFAFITVIERAINAFAVATPATALMLSRKGIMPVIIGSTLLVIGSVIIIIVLTISGQIQSQFACQTGDTACTNARNLLNIVPIIAGAVLVLAGVFMMIPQIRSR